MEGTLLLVDDEENILRSLVRLLRGEGYRILTATGGAAALQMLAGNEVQVILSDQRMPGMSGSEMLSHVKELYPDTVRMVLSGYADLASVTDAINRGNIYKFLIKPWDDDLLRANIREAFDRYELGRKGAQFTKIYENTVEGILITDGDGRIQAVNPAFSAITGYDVAEALGKTPAMLRSGKHDAEFYRDLWRCLLEDGKWTGEIWNRRKDGAIYPEWLNITAIRDRHGHLQQYVGLFTDITEHKQAEEKLRYQAYHDPLTDLPNRLMYTEHLDMALPQAQRREEMCGIMMLDLDHFKYVNDTYGHEFGDKLLIHVAQRLRDCIRKEDTLARMGGDEFTFLLPLVADVKDVARVAEKILAAFARPVAIAGKELFVTPSIGISLFPGDGKDAETLLKNADAAMYRAKEGGRNAYQFYTADMNAQAQQRMSLENDLRRALERQELEMYYQPKVALKSGRIVAAEALIRWHHPTRGFVPPSEFIPLAEENGLILPIGEWLVNEVCRQIRRWRDDGLPTVPCIAVNLSGRQFQRQNLPDLLTQAIADAGIEPGDLELELTEGTIMSNAETNIEMLVMLKRMGMSLAIDDFGTGYSSLSYLKRFPIDVLKIDYSFVRDIAHDAASAELVRGVIGMAHGLKLEVVAEGVETPEQLAFLRQHDCDIIQGFLFSKAVPAAAFADLVRADKRL
ncbi:MAG: EAL domain-containing protein [Rhodocyclales bacterium]|nr:EAL domain-containing protein [Rhodocyclales bacterium]